jgi:hypothetical protein
MIRILAKGLKFMIAKIVDLCFNDLIFYFNSQKKSINYWMKWF